MHIFQGDLKDRAAIAAHVRELVGERAETYAGSYSTLVMVADRDAAAKIKSAIYLELLPKSLKPISEG